ncbi:MAG: branched-chain amino acid ABC transporter permease [Actinobacteria bacterium]|nr:branched-chain amino acid ABC transporter permease [Actinomycetota bacterium]
MKPSEGAAVRIAFGRRIIVLPPALVALVLVAGGLPLVDNLFYLDIITLTLIWGAIAGAWNISGGFAGQFSLGHSAFLGIGAYTSTLLYVRLGVTPWIGLLAGGTLAAMVAGILGGLTFRLKGPFFTLVTIAFAQLVNIAAVQLRRLTSGSLGINIPFTPGVWNFTFENRVVYAYAALGLLVLVYGISTWLGRSKLGYYLVAMRENEDAARSLGVDSFRAKVVVTIVSAFLTAVAGSFLAQYILFIEPDSVLSVELSIQMAMISIIGGLGTAVTKI